MILQDIAECLGGARKTSNGFDCRCPLHDDKSASMSIHYNDAGEPEGFCHKGCDPREVNKRLRERYPSAYPQKSYEPRPEQRWTLSVVDGSRLFTKVRYYDRDGKKKYRIEPKLSDFSLGTKDLCLYGSNTLGDAVEVAFGEGEKTTDAMRRLGLNAVGSSTGAAGLPCDEALLVLKGRSVTLWPDNDEPGLGHMLKIAERLTALGIHWRAVQWPDAPPKGDAADFVAMGGTLEQFNNFPTVDLSAKREGTVIDFPKSRKPQVESPLNIATTDMGNATRFVRKLKGKVRYCPPRKMWMIGRGTHWSWDETGEIVRLAKDVVRDIYKEASKCQNKEQREAIAAWAHKSESKQRIDAMIALAQSEEGIPVLPSELDADPYLLGVKNGVLDLRTGKLTTPDPSQLITKQMGAVFDAAATSDLWNSFLKDVSGGDAELEKYLQRVVGYSLFGTVCEKLFWFFYGPPDTGKSRFIGAVKAMFGDYARAVDFSTWCIQAQAGGNRGDLVDLLGARLAVSVEVRRGAKFDEAVLKKITGGDDLKFAAKYEREIEFKPTFALFLAANDAPIIRDDDQGVWTRLCRVPFSCRIPKEKQDRHLEEKLSAPEVQSAILNWAVEGFRQWQEQGIGTCAAVDGSNAEYRRDMDRFEGFLSECCEFHPFGKVATRELKEAYEKWAEIEGVFPLSPRDFNKRLQEKGCTKTFVNRAKGWSFIRLKANENVELGRHDNSRDKGLFDHASY
jgi:putative DNA primase/helicase